MPEVAAATLATTIGRIQPPLYYLKMVYCKQPGWPVGLACLAHDRRNDHGYLDVCVSHVQGGGNVTQKEKNQRLGFTMGRTMITNSKASLHTGVASQRNPSETKVGCRTAPSTSSVVLPTTSSSP